MSRLPTPRRALGQHWLHDPMICARIAALASPERGYPIFEIGPGAGGLTAPLLASGVSVSALELDDRLADRLETRFATECASGQLTVLRGDARTVRLTSGQPWVVIGNLPYNAGAYIYLNLLEQPERIAKMVLMFQAEVAQRILAGPGTRSRGFLSVLTAMEWSGRRAMRVRPGAFKPPPKVLSDVLVLERDTEAPGRPLPRAASRNFVDICFHTRRKMLRNTLRAAGWEDGAVRSALAAAGLSASIRAEAVPIEAFTILFELLGSPRNLPSTS